MRIENHRERMLNENTALSYVEVNGTPEVALIDYSRNRLAGRITILAQGEESLHLFETLGPEEARHLAGQLRAEPEPAARFGPDEAGPLSAGAGKTPDKGMELEVDL